MFAVAWFVAGHTIALAVENSDCYPIGPGLPEYLVETQLPPELCRLESQGRLRELEAVLSRERAPASPLDNASHAPALPPELRQREKDRLRRLRREFSITPEEFLDQLRHQIPDCRMDDLRRWMHEGTLQCLSFDGRVWIFRREPANLFRFSSEAQHRRRPLVSPTTAMTSSSADSAVARPSSYFVLNRHLRDIVEAASSTSAPLTHTVRVRCRHEIHLAPGHVPAGAKVRCWFPFPRKTPFQRQIRLLAADPEPIQIAPEDAPQRTVTLERLASPDGTATFSIEFEFLTAAWTPLLSATTATEILTPTQRAAFLAEEPPHLQLRPSLRALADQIAAPTSTPLERARALFNWVVANIHYAAEMEYCLMPSILDKALATRRGDCGVQALTFIALCRAAGIPARWASGWVVYPSGWNMHDWAEFYVEPYGWLPADPSRGWRDDDDPRVRQFFFGNLDAYRMVANAAIASSFTPPPRFWRSDPVDNQRGELEWDGGNLYYDQWTYRVAIHTERLP